MDELYNISNAIILRNKIVLSKIQKFNIYYNSFIRQLFIIFIFPIILAYKTKKNADP